MFTHRLFMQPHIKSSGLADPIHFVRRQSDHAIDLFDVQYFAGPA